MRNTLAPAGIAVAAATPFAAGAQQASAAQQSLFAATSGAAPETWVVDAAPVGAEGAAEHDAPPQQSSAAGIAGVISGNLDMSGLETLKWV